MLHELIEIPVVVECKSYVFFASPFLEPVISMVFDFGIRPLTHINLAKLFPKTNSFPSAIVNVSVVNEAIAFRKGEFANVLVELGIVPIVKKLLQEVLVAK